MKSVASDSQRIRVAHPWSALLAAAVCALALQACGGGGGGSNNNGEVVNPPPNPGGNPGTGGGTPLPPAARAPAVGSGPFDQTVTVRQAASFTVTEANLTPVAYQWLRNGVDIPGATQALYGFIAQPADAGARFQVRLSNAAGSVTSNPAVLTVLEAPTGELSLVAGAIGGAGNLDGAGAAARFDGPSGLAVDAAGNVLVADNGVRRITSDGVVGPLSPNFVLSARSIAVNAAGQVFVATSERNPALYRIVPDGSPIKVADFTANPALLTIAIDRAGNVIAADSGANAIVRIDPASGQSTILAGGRGVGASSANPGGAFSSVCALAVDSGGNILFADATANTIRRLAPDGSITVLVPESAGLQRPCGLVIDAAGNLLVADSGNQAIRKVTPSGALSTVTGAGGSIGTQDGPATSARFVRPTGLALAPNGTLYIADSNTVRRLDPAGNVATIAGLAASVGPAFGRYHATDAAGNVYLAQSALFTLGDPYLLQKITPAGDTTTFSIGLTNPQGIALDDAGNVYVADARLDCSSGSPTNCRYYGVLLKFDIARRQLDVLAGMSAPPANPDDLTERDVDGIGTRARFGSVLTDLAVDAAGNVYVGQSGAVRKVSPDGVVSTLTNKIGTIGLAVDRAGNNVYVGNCSVVSASIGGGPILQSRLSRIDALGNVTELNRPVGNPVVLGDGSPGAALYYCPAGMALDAAGNLYTAYPTLHSVRKLSPDGVNTTVVGQPPLRGIQLGPLPASLLSPTDLSFDGAGNLYVGSTQAILKARFSK